jgi:peptide/nickel transport system substrate-binding protein
MKNKWYIYILISILLVSCAPPLSGTSPSGGVIARALTTEPSGLDPHGVASSGQNVVLPYLLDTLVYRDTDNSFKPYLAEKWEVAPDGKVITFTLKKGITFHDGTPLNAEAVKFTFQRVIQQGQRSPLASGFADISGIDVLDNLTLKISFKQPTAIFLSSISTAYAGIISPTAVQQLGDQFALKPVGSGAFKFEEWQPGVSITLTRNSNYRWAPSVLKNQAAPLIEKLVFKVIPDANTQFRAFQSGEIDILFINQTNQVEKLKNDPQTNLNETTLNSLIYLGFNCQKPPFDDVRVRQALSHAVDKNELVQTALGGIGEIAFAPLSNTLPGFDPQLKSFELGYNPAKTAELLGQAGFVKQADGTWNRPQTGSSEAQPFKVNLLISTRAPNEALATVIQGQFKKAGIPVTIKSLEANAATDAATKGDYDLFIWRYDWNDADVLNTYLSSSRIGRTNRNFYKNAELDKILDQASKQLDAKERNQSYFAAQKIILQDAPWQPLYIPKDYIAINKRVQDVVVGLMGRLLLNDATIKP